MGWIKYRAGNEWIWKCSEYSDLDYTAITNLAEHGQPVTPYEREFDHDFEPDFGNIIVEMPQLEVMTKGYGQTVEARSFPVVNRFLGEAFPFPPGTYTFTHLVQLGFAVPEDRFISGSLYKMGVELINGLKPGSIGAGDAAYIHGTVGFSLMSDTQFTYSATTREVDAEIGALNDNWDFRSNTVPDIVNATASTALGPDHYNLDAPITFRFTGPGKRSKISNSLKPPILKQIRSILRL